MAYRLRYDRRFKRSLAALPGDIRGMARRMIARLASAKHQASIPRHAAGSSRQDYWILSYPRELS